MGVGLEHCTVITLVPVTVGTPAMWTPRNQDLV